VLVRVHVLMRVHVHALAVRVTDASGVGSWKMVRHEVDACSTVSGPCVAEQMRCTVVW
jgi:hypothetical protein